MDGQPSTLIQQHTAYAYLGLYGDFDPAAITADISLLPDKAQAKHSQNPERRIPRTSIVRYGETRACDESPDIYELADAVVAILEPHADALIPKVEVHCDAVVLQVVVYLPLSEGGATPPLGFSQKAVAFISRLGGSIDIDCYKV